MGALTLTVAATFRLLSEQRLTIERLDPHALMRALALDGLLEDDAAFYMTMIERFAERAAYDAATTERLASVFTVMLWGILVMLCGLALAAIVG